MCQLRILFCQRALVQPVGPADYTSETENLQHVDTAITGGSCHKYQFCRDKHTFVATKDVFCRDKNDTRGNSRQ